MTDQSQSLEDLNVTHQSSVVHALKSPRAAPESAPPIKEEPEVEQDEEGGRERFWFRMRGPPTHVRDTLLSERGDRKPDVDLRAASAAPAYRPKKV